MKEKTLPIGEEQLRAARQTLMKYKCDKANLEQKVISNEQWWKLRHWEQMRSSKDDPKAASAWLWNIIVSKHAEAMDSYPEPVILPRMPDDTESAKQLSAVIPVILDNSDFDTVYSDIQWNKLKQGTGVYGIFWDKSKNCGLGDVSVKKVDILSLFWEGGIGDIQRSKNLFYADLCDNEELLARYPQLERASLDPALDLARYRYDDNVDTNGKSLVIDWYYHKEKNGRRLLHYCKFVGDTLLFSTENDEENYPCGWYEHGLYPFVFDTLFDIEGTPCGYGYIDIGKDAQAQIDYLNNAIINNAMLAAKPRYFIRGDGSVNEEEFADWTKDFVHTNGNLGRDSILQIEVNPINPIYVSILNNKIEELKETSGNRDTNNGGTVSGVTAASAIAALQEAASKLTRDSVRRSYAAYRQVISQCIELVRQFYDIPRYFRITGESGNPEFTFFSNNGILPIPVGDAFGVDMGMRAPAFDINITAQKNNPYTRMSQNEMALQFYNLGFFDPLRADMALACLEMMDFNHKEKVMDRIRSLRAASAAALPVKSDTALPKIMNGTQRARAVSAEGVIP